MIPMISTIMPAIGKISRKTAPRKIIADGFHTIIQCSLAL